jgi:hypothetical protein
MTSAEPRPRATRSGSSHGTQRAHTPGILHATQEYDRLGREAFLDKYGFGQARSYLLVHDGKAYVFKAIVGAAHGFLPGRSALTSADFSGGAATVGRLLTNLGFEVRTDAGTTLTTSQLLDKIARLRRSPCCGRSAGHCASCRGGHRGPRHRTN